MTLSIDRKAVLLDAVRHFGSGLNAGDLTLAAYREAIAGTLRAHFDCARVGLWRIVGGPTARRMRCDGLAVRGEPYVEPRHVMAVECCADYLAWMGARGTFASSDVHADAHLQELQAYFDDTGVRASMDSAFQINGEMFGVIRLEEIDRAREWSMHEQSALREAVFLISLTIARMGPRFDFDGHDAIRRDDGPTPY